MKKLIEANGLGNTFLIADYGDRDVEALSKSEITRLNDLLKLSRRDSLLLTSDRKPTDNVNCWTTMGHGKKMRVLERDGTESLMCGNGLRALAEYCRETEGVHDLIVETRAGLRSTKFLEQGCIRAELGRFESMGQMKLFEGMLYDSHVGEPHAVMMARHEEIDALFERHGLALASEGRIQTTEGWALPGTRNLNVITADDIDPWIIYNRTFERGVNRETKSCGTGSACAASIYVHERLGTNNFKVTVITNGGKLMVHGQNGLVSIVGTATVEKIYEFPIVE